jgi:hypothetical protein
MSIFSQRLCVWCGPVLLLVYFIGFWPIAHFIPPPSPLLSAESIAQMYVEHANQIRVGLVVGLFAVCFIIPWVSALTVQLRRIEGRHSPGAYSLLALMVLVPVVFIIPMMIFLIATYRPETRSAEITSTLNDAGWLFFVMTVFPGPPMMLSFAIPVLRDRRANPVFPRWAGYLSIWAEFMFIPGALAVFVKSGPLAWNGVLAFYVPLFTFAIWMLVLSKLMLDAIAAQAREEADAGDHLASVPTGSSPSTV